jgi:hypothetical protein
VLSTPHLTHSPQTSQSWQSAGPAHADGQRVVYRTGTRGQRGRSRKRRTILILGLIFLLGYIAQRVIQSISQSNWQPNPPSNSGDSGLPGAESGSIEPFANEPPTEFRPSPASLAALRSALNDEGYNNVQFKMDGDTIILRGKVRTYEDRATIQLLCSRIGGITSLRDELTVSGDGG